MPTDTERMDFLESLRDRTIFVNKKSPAYYKPTDIHINGPDRCILYARSLDFNIEFQGYGESVRAAIDAAMIAGKAIYGSV